MRVVVSIGGSILAPDLDAGRVAGHAEVIGSLADEGCEIGIVVGGGGVAREYIDTARQLDANEVQLDQLGIDVTRINARLLISALEADVKPTPATDYDTAGDALRRGDISVMGGITAGQTTDAVAAAFAEYIDADCSSTRRAPTASTMPTRTSTPRRSNTRRCRRPNSST